MSQIILLNKPFQVLSQFTDAQGRQTLADFIAEKHVYCAGRLDYDSEGLLLLTGDGRLQQQITDPRFKLEKTYWVQLDGTISDQAIERLQKGVELKDGMTRPARCRRLAAPQVWPRVPPIRQRNNDITSWIELKIREGRNRQVRRMTAAVGFPTLRLIRQAIGNWSLNGLQPGQSRCENVHLPRADARQQNSRRQAHASGTSKASSRQSPPRSRRR